MRSLHTLIAAGVVFLGATSALADEKQSLEMKIIAKKDTYPLDLAGKSADEYRKMLTESAKKEMFARLLKPPAVDLVLEIKNTGDKGMTILVGGDPNVVTFDLKGPGVYQLHPMLAVTQEFRLPREVILEPGKAHEIPIKFLADGMRNVGRYIYWLDHGEYTLAATYQLSATADGVKGQLLKAEPIKLKVVEPEKN